MSEAGFSFDNTFAATLEGLYAPCTPTRYPAPQLVFLNEALAVELGLDVDRLRDEAAAILAGQTIPHGATPLAQAYAGHQFGGFSPQLGDGRAVLLGEVVDAHGQRRDVQLKGSGRTPFSRGGDGRATLGPILREVLVGEAMHRLGVPTTRALAAATTGEQVWRTSLLPGAVLARVASSHLRIGTFQFVAARGDLDTLARLVDYAVARHVPAPEVEPGPRGLLRHVARSQARLIAAWMGTGFVHGVMNTDNASIAGETLDYGPCAFMDRYDPATVFSSIDHHGRYAYGQQPAVGAWNVARLAEALLPLLDADEGGAIRVAEEAVALYVETYQHHWLEGIRRKLGLTSAHDADRELVSDLLELLHTQSVDFTSAFRALADLLRTGGMQAASPWFADLAALEAWCGRWRSRIDQEAADHATVARAMDQVNPLYIPRNHKVEEALDAAVAGDRELFDALLDVVSHPFEARPGLEAYATPAPAGVGPYLTYCGT